VTYLFHIGVCLMLVIFQTAVKPQMQMLAGFYDVLTAYVIYLGLFHRVREVLPIILISGLVMDTISGGPMGLFLTSYLWIFLLTRWTTRLLHQDNLVLHVFIVGAGVIFQTGVYVGTTFLLDKTTLFAAPTLDVALTQVLWALGTGALLLLLFRRSYRLWEQFLNTYFVRESAQSGG
jgi:cell shape-determining protein MreD